jgi:hypothetical protein
MPKAANEREPQDQRRNGVSRFRTFAETELLLAQLGSQWRRFLYFPVLVLMELLSQVYPTRRNHKQKHTGS